MKPYIIVALLAVALAFLPVPGHSLNLQLTNYDPLPAEAGKLMTIWIKAENLDSSRLLNSTFTLVPEFPLKLVSEATKKYGSITGFSEIILEYRLSVENNAPEGIAKFEIQYTTSSESVVSKKQFNITVKNPKDTADLEALFVEIVPFAAPGMDATLTLDIVNRASGTSLFTVVKASSEIADISRDQIFVGNLEPDDFDSVDFVLKIRNGTEPGRYPVNVEFRYKDEDDFEYTSQGVVYVDVISAEEASALTRVETPAWTYAVYLIAAIVLLKYIIFPVLKRAAGAVKSLAQGKKK